MIIRKVTLDNYRCFEKIEVGVHDRLTVIVGGNGSGKTAILEGAAVSLGTFFTGLDALSGVSIHKNDAHLKAYRMGESEDIQAQYPVKISAEGMLGQNEIKWIRSLNREGGTTTTKEAKPMLDIAKDYQTRLRAGDGSLVLPLIAYYGTGRLWDYHREKKSDTFKKNTKTNGYIDSLDGTANIKLMMNWFRKKTVQLAQKSAVGFNTFLALETVYGAMRICFERVTGYKDVKFLYNLDTNEIDCYYTGDDGLPMNIPLPQMSDGYKNTISLIADIAYRMAVLNPQLGTNILQDTDGVVLIDEIDLHLHPAWQHRILSDLQAIFPKVQFIVTTHAPAVISSAKSENLVILKNYEVLDAAAEIYGNDINSILKSIMGVSDRNPVIAELFEKFYSLLNDGQYDGAEKVLDEIEVKKGCEPDGLKELREECLAEGLSPKESFKRLLNPLKGQVMECLKRDQGQLCVYCMSRIPREDKDLGTPGQTIEHFVPLEPGDGRDVGQGLDYQNLFAVCHDNTKRHKKGVRRTSSKDDLTCDKRRENKEFKKTERKAALDELIKDIERVEKNDLHKYCIDMLALFMDERDSKTPYVGILIWYLRSLATALS